MTKLNLVEINEGKEEILATGTEKELLQAWEENKTDWIGWISEQEPEKYEELKQIEIESIEDLENLFETELDYSWYNLQIR